MKALIRKILIGQSTISEYSTVTIADGIREKVYLETAGNILDISDNHWILCIEPVIFGVWLGKESAFTTGKDRPHYRIYFHDGPFLKDAQKGAVAEILLEYFDHIEEPNGTLVLLKLTKTHLHHINPLKSYLLFNRYYKKNGLTFKQFKAFAAAYSYPRQIRVVSYRQGDYYNIFPMDLVGDISQSNRYVFGLRHTNATLNRIVETGKLVISEVPHHYKTFIYQLGKHHSNHIPTLNHLPFEVMETETFGFYIPLWAETYKEIRILKTINLGSHLLLWGMPLAEKRLSIKTDHLYLIHFMHYLHQQKKNFQYQLI